MSKSWKTIDTIKVKLHDPNVTVEKDPYRSMVGNKIKTVERSEAEFKVKWARSAFNGHMSSHVSKEETEDFAIENELLDIKFTGKTIKECLVKLNAWLETAQNITGTWELWVEVEAKGYQSASGYSHDGYASIDMNFYAIYKVPGREPKHMAYTGEIADPFTGEWKHPTTYNELARLSRGLPDAASKSDRWGKRKPEEERSAYLRATPEVVNTIRFMQKRLASIGDEVQERLRPQRIDETIKLVQSGGMKLLGEPTAEKNRG